MLLAVLTFVKMAEQLFTTQQPPHVLATVRMDLAETFANTISPDSALPSTRVATTVRALNLLTAVYTIVPATLAIKVKTVPKFAKQPQMVDLTSQSWSTCLVH